MGPQGSVRKSPWQLVEVSGKDAGRKVSVSQPGTPLITGQRSPQLGAQRSPNLGPQQTPQRTPQQSPALGPANSPLEEKNIDHPSGDKQTAQSERAEPDGRWGDNEEDGGAALPEDGFDSRYFLGNWTDNIGHMIMVTATEASGRRDRRRRNKGEGKGRGQLGFLAVMYKFGMPDKRFNINKDRRKNVWSCGNGVLDQETSTQEKMHWKAADGRISTWDRSPPEGPVFFDAPPAVAYQEEQLPPWFDHCGEIMGGLFPGQDGEYFAGPPQGEWKGLHLPDDPDDPLQPQPTGGSDETSAAPAEDGATGTSGQWNLKAPEFVMPSTVGPDPAAAAAPSMPVHPPPVGVQAAACQLQLSEESPDVAITANRLEWVLPDNWGKLSRFPKDFCLTSPMFGVRQAANMQLVFYPNGSRTAEAGRCTVALTRGPDSAGIKFEFSVNGRGSGPKVCLGRRYLGDYPKPYDESEETKTQQVSVCMQVLEVLGV